MTGLFSKLFLLVAVVLAAVPLPVSAQDAPTSPLEATHPVLASSLERLKARSASFREALNAVAATGRQALVITPDRVKTPMTADTLAQVFPLADEQSRLDTVLVVINLDLLQKLSRLPIDFEDDIDRIIAHEVYGHAIPLLLAGHLAGHCADPAVGQSAIASCVIQRENVIRREMWLGQRVEYGRDSLVLGRRYRH